MKQLVLALLVSTAFARNVTTTFPAPAENPISQSNNWTNASGSWGAVQTSSGLAFGVSQPTQFGDATAVYKGSWGPSQTVQGTVRIVTNGASIREVELRGRTVINPTSITGYELLCNVSTGQTYGCQFVRWNGAAGDFTIIANYTAVPRVLDGDVIKMVFNGTTVSSTRNGVTMTWNRDSQCGNNSGANQTTLDLTCPNEGGAIYQNGAPGLAFYREPGGNDSQFSQYGWSQWSANDEVPALSCSTANVNTAMTAAFAGDTVTIPAGNCNWTGMAFTKAITLQGAGAGQTVLTATGQNTFTNSSVGVMRFQGMTFNNGGLGGPPYAWFIGSGGNWKSTYPIVFQNMAFITPWTITHSGSDTTSNFRVERAGGVIWANNTFDCGWDCDFIQFKDPGDASGSWTNADTFGIRDASTTLTGTIASTTGFLNFYLEDNVFTGGSNQGIDCDDGCRMVARHNTFINSELNSHGFDTSAWGERHSEIYNNTFRNTCSEATSQNQANCEEFGLGNSSRQNVSQQIWLRGGTHIIYLNDMENASNTWWGTKPQVRMNIRAVSQPSLIGVTCGSLTYPVPRALGQNTNGTSAFTDPIYFYNNTVKVQGGTGSNWSLAQINEAGTDWPNDSFCTSQINNFSTVYFQSPRDVVNLPLKVGSAKPGYTAFTYPHPLVTGQAVPTPLTITTSTLPGATVGVAYSTTLTAVGGTTPYTWTISTGTLPAGLTLSTAGVISGTPTTAVVSNFTVRVTDAVSATTTQPLSITVTGVNFTISGTVTGVANSGVTVALTGTSSASTTTNGSGAYSFGGLTSGNYTVTPTKTGYAFTPASTPITITSGNGTVNFTIKPAAPTNLTLVVN